MGESGLARIDAPAPESNGLTLTTLLAADMPGARNISGLDNQAAVFGRLIPQIPAAVAETLADDWRNHKGAMAAKIGMAAALGTGSAILLARSPMLAKSLLGLAGLAGGTHAAIGTGRFAVCAWNADSEAQRNALVADGRRSLGRIGADLLETAPALVAGTRVGIGLTKRFASLDSTALSVRDKINNPLHERLSYLRGDAKTLTGVSGETGIDLLKVADDMATRTPWSSVEEARLFRATQNKAVKIGGKVSGTADEVMLGGRFDNVFHTHGSRILPTSGDFTAVNGTGVISIPERGLLTFYSGNGAQAGAVEQMLVRGRTTAAFEAATNLQGQTFRSLVVDKSQGLAVRVDAVWVDKVGLQPKAVTVVEFDEALKVLQSWDGRRLAIETLTTPAPRMIEQGGMADLLRRLATGG